MNILRSDLPFLRLPARPCTKPGRREVIITVIGNNNDSVDDDGNDDNDSTADIYESNSDGHNGSDSNKKI